MKKVLIVISLSLLLFGCGKEQKNITVNFYENNIISTIYIHTIIYPHNHAVQASQ